MDYFITISPTNPHIPPFFQRVGDCPEKLPGELGTGNLETGKLGHPIPPPPGNVGHHDLLLLAQVKFGLIENPPSAWSVTSTSTSRSELEREDETGPERG